MKTLITKLFSSVAGFAVGAGALLCAPAAWAQDFPNRPMTIIAAYPPASGPDIFARLLAPSISEQLGQPVIVENRPGALGVAAVQYLLEQPADGHTMLIGDTSLLILAPYLEPNLQYDPLEVMEPVALIGSQPYILAASNAANDFASLQDVVDAAQANPGSVRFGTPGFGSNHHVIMEALALAAGVQMTPIHYTGGAAQNAGVLAGEIDIVLSSYGALLPHLEAGAVTLLATSTPERFPLYPDLPAVAETFPGFGFTSEPGVVVAAGVPAEAIAILSGAIEHALNDPAIQEGFMNVRFLPQYGDSAAYAANLADNARRFAEVIEASNMMNR